ncbi:MAG TPA: chloride channel protein [Gammaproteobacteria bacterium]|nr:chloride channel protein [Gammaproteobacteria bacterium]
MFHRIRRSGRKLLSADAWKARLVFWTGAILLGLISTAFAHLTDATNGLFHGVMERWQYAPLVICPLGMGLVGWLTKRFARGAQGSGIPQCIAALGMREHVSRSRLLSLKIAVSKIGLTLMGMLSGASIGREGPTVHVGAAIMFSLGRWAKFPYHYMDHGLILAGGAAGIGAAFNTPLAGILFAIEEMSRSFEERTSGTLLTAVVLAGITSVAIQGNYTYFGTTQASLEPNQVWLPIIVCGVVGGMLGGLFSTLLLWGSRKLSYLLTHRPELVAAGCGLAIALIGMASGNLTFGTGYEHAKEVVTQSGTVPTSYPYLKMLATLVSYVSGIPGGLFAPTLASGAGLGQNLAHLMPGLPAGAIIILGMVGYFTGVVQTPITSFVIVMEMTDNPGLLLPLMATSFIAYATSRLVCPEPVYQALARAFLPRRVAPPEAAAAAPAEGVDTRVEDSGQTVKAKAREGARPAAAPDSRDS